MILTHVVAAEFFLLGMAAGAALMLMVLGAAEYLRASRARGAGIPACAISRGVGRGPQQEVIE